MVTSRKKNRANKILPLDKLNDAVRKLVPLLTDSLLKRVTEQCRIEINFDSCINKLVLFINQLVTPVADEVFSILSLSVRVGICMVDEVIYVMSRCCVFIEF